MATKVSVIVPVYNTAIYVRQCLDSLLNQKLRDIEIICVDDGSPDDAGVILDEYAQKDKRVFVLHKKNGGRGTAYNAGLKLAKGEYVAFLDSDDWIEPTAFYDLYQVAQKYKTDVVRAGAYWGMSSDFDGHLEIQIPQQKCEKVIDNMLFLPELVSRHVAHWSGIYKNSFLKENGIRCFEENEMPDIPMGILAKIGKLFGRKYPPIQKCVPDIGFMYKVWLKAKSCYVIPNAYVHYRCNQPTSSMASGAKLSFGLLAEHIKIRDYMKMASSNASQGAWRIKTRVEFEHFITELANRCRVRRADFVFTAARIFRENLRGNLVNQQNFSEEEWNLYQFIAWCPFLWVLNDMTRFWKTIHAWDQTTISWRLFGLYKKVRTLNWTKQYFLGIRFYFEHNYDGELAQMKEQLFGLQNQLNYMTTLLRKEK